MRHRRFCCRRRCCLREVTPGLTLGIVCVWGDVAKVYREHAARRCQSLAPRAWRNGSLLSSENSLLVRGKQVHHAEGRVDRRKSRVIVRVSVPFCSLKGFSTESEISSRRCALCTASLEISRGRGWVSGCQLHSGRACPSLPPAHSDSLSGSLMLTRMQYKLLPRRL